MLLDHLFLIMAANFGAAVFSGALGMGGGVLVTGALSTVLPITVVIPLQNMMMLLTSGSRVWMFKDGINWRLAWPFIVGLASGVGVGTFVYAFIPPQWLQLIVGLSMLSVLVSPQRVINRIGSSVALRLSVGGAHGFLSALTSMGGLLQGTFARLKISKTERNGTFAVLVSLGNLFKAFGYALAGISIWVYWPVFLMAIPIGYCGTWVGKNLLDEMISENVAQRLFQALVLFSAGNLIFKFVQSTVPIPAVFG